MHLPSQSHDGGAQPAHLATGRQFPWDAVPKIEPEGLGADPTVEQAVRVSGADPVLARSVSGTSLG